MDLTFRDDFWLRIKSNRISILPCKRLGRRLWLALFVYLSANPDPVHHNPHQSWLPAKAAAFGKQNGLEFAACQIGFKQ